MKIRISVAAKEEGGNFWRIYLSQRSIICYKISRPLLKFWKHKCDRQQLFVEQNTSYPIKQSEKKKKKNPREQVLAIRDKEKDVADKPSIKFAIPVQAYVVPVPFPRRLRKQLKNEQANAITTKSEFPLL